MTNSVAVDTRSGNFNLPTSERILSTAATLFRQKGYTASTTRELAELLGIRKASLYHHIEGKEEILYQICVASLTRIIDGSSQLLQSLTSEEELRAVIRWHVIEVAGTQDFHAVMLTEMKGLTAQHLTEVVAMRDHYQDLIRDAIATCQNLGIIRNDVSPKYLMLCLLNLLNWTIFWFKPGGELSAEELGDLLVSIFVEGARQSASRNEGDIPVSALAAIRTPTPGVREENSGIRQKGRKPRGNFKSVEPK